MNSYWDNLWFLLDEWIHDAEIKCQEYDVQLFFVKEKFLDYILLIIHKTRNSRCHFLIRSNLIFRTCNFMAIDMDC